MWKDVNMLNAVCGCTEMKKKVMIRKRKVTMARCVKNVWEKLPKTRKLPACSEKY
jgi:hypothetical protein